VYTMLDRVVGRARARVVVLFFGFGALSACVRPPDLQPIANSSATDQKTSPGSISINEVVKRVKCEIRDAIASRFGKRYAWFNKWTITADLSLTVNDNSQISPGLVLNHQFLTGAIPQRVSNFSQSASLGLGGQASTTAARTEIVSFSTSVKEIKEEFFDKGETNPAATNGYNGCLPYGAFPMDLTGKLGLKEWVDSALGPVTDPVGPNLDRPLLREGFHQPAKAPSGGAAAKSSGAVAGAVGASGLFDFFKFKEQNQELFTDKKQTPVDPAKIKEEKELEEKVHKIGEQLTALREAETHIDENKAIIKTMADKKQVGEPLSDSDYASLKMAQAGLTDVIKRQKAALEAITAVLPLLRKACGCTSAKDAPKTIDQWMGPIQTLLETDRDRLIKAIPKPPTPKYNPPIDAISHQVQFIIVFNASANPTWTMLNFKGPSPTSGSFLSGTDTNTHTLTIVMGEPSSPAATNARSSLTFGAAVSNQLIPQLPQNSTPLFQ
jgi:hypothetical protein